MKELFNILLYQPFYNLLIVFYRFAGDLGIAIIFFTALIKLALWPLSKKAIAAQLRMQELKPKMDEVKRQYKGDPRAQNQAMMALYSKEKFNPAASCLPVLIQFPILIAVYLVFTNGIKGGAADATLLYGFISAPETIVTTAFGFLDLSVKSLIAPGANFTEWQFNLTFAVILPFLSAIGQFWQTKMMMKVNQARSESTAKEQGSENTFDSMNKQMVYTMPIMTFFFGLILPSGLSLYWFVGTIMTIIQQYYSMKAHEKRKAA